ncbi:hypothetical protein COO60DRAFT_25711 [Scenedesmus sp. NREL 46B-D3]|nr:hypothetical protein COO60DRAFT_25711 [Scenedesmus sp. NREL 46B-D3]
MLLLIWPPGASAAPCHGAKLLQCKTKCSHEVLPRATPLKSATCTVCSTRSSMPDDIRIDAQMHDLRTQTPLCDRRHHARHHAPVRHPIPAQCTNPISNPHSYVDNTRTHTTHTPRAASTSATVHNDPSSPEQPNPSPCQTLALEPPASPTRKHAAPAEPHLQRKRKRTNAVRHTLALHAVLRLLTDTRLIEAGACHTACCRFPSSLNLQRGTTPGIMLHDTHSKPTAQHAAHSRSAGRPPPPRDATHHRHSPSAAVLSGLSRNSPGPASPVS